MKLEGIKNRVEAYVVFIGVMAAAATAVILNLSNIGEEAKSERDLIKANITAMKDAQEASNVAESRLLKARLDPIAKMGENLRQELAIVKANLDGLSVASTKGDAERQRLLEGRLVVLQNQMYNMTMGQEAFMDTLSSISREIELLKATQAGDTMVVIDMDTLYVDKKGRWWNPFD
jgi:hypothetical protein